MRSRTKPTSKATGGNFDPTDRLIYFVASHADVLRNASKCHNYVLIAVNELMSERYVEMMEKWLDAGVRVFLDSGVFWLTNEHVRAHPGMRMDQALQLPPNEIDGFDVLFNRYVDLARRFGDRLWGYIELDQGGRENKVKTRTMLEDMGLAPIPVYHPFNDGWDYFDQLAETYDRVCFGNVVQASRDERKRLVATAWERHRKYPDLWIHLLGLTPNELLNAFPCDSADSSSWLTPIRWAMGGRETSALKSFSEMPREFTYVLGSDADGDRGRNKAYAMAAMMGNFMQRNWRYHHERLHDYLGLETYPQ